MRAPRRQLRPLVPGQGTLRLAMLACAIIMLWLALFVDLEDFIRYWHWVKQPWMRQANPLIIPAFAGLILSALLFWRSALAGLLCGSVFLRLALDLLSNLDFAYRQREIYVQEAFHLDLHNILFDYHSAIEQGHLQAFLETKPPGTMLYYKLVHLLFRPLFSDPMGEDLYYFTNFFTYGVLTLLGILFIGLVYHSIRLAKSRRWAIVLSGLVLVSPHFLLLPMEFSTRLSPVIVLGLWRLTRESSTERSILGAGALWALGTYIDFGLLAAVVLPLAMLTARGAGKAAARGLALFAVGVVAVYLPIMLGTGYNPVARAMEAIAAHEHLFETANMPLWLKWNYAILQFGELFLAAGPGLGVLFLAGLFRGGFRKYWPLCIYILALIFSGSVVSEAARLWIVAIGPMAIIAGESIASRRTRWVAVGLHLVVVLVYLWAGYFTWSQ